MFGWLAYRILNSGIGPIVRRDSERLLDPHQIDGIGLGAIERSPRKRVARGEFARD